MVWAANHCASLILAGPIAQSAFFAGRVCFTVRTRNTANRSAFGPRTRPKVNFKAKRAITWKEHQAILAGEMNLEGRAFYGFCWHLGGAQSAVASPTQAIAFLQKSSKEWAVPVSHWYGT